MFVWYAVGVAAAVWAVFDSPALDYRFVMAGALLPLTELALGRPGPLHSLTVAVAVMALVMAITQGRGRRLTRRRWLGIPIGLMGYLVLSGSWADTDAFWWPVLGTELSDADPPELARGLLSVVLEIAGIAIAVWWARRVGLDDAAGRRSFIRTGRLPRSTPRMVDGAC